jgi:hypothetical protein
LIFVGIDEEFARFNPEYDDLLEARVHHYFKTIENRPPDSDWIHCVVDDWARRVDVPTNVAPWAFGVFLEATMVFRELIGSDSASIQ